MCLFYRIYPVKCTVLDREDFTVTELTTFLVIRMSLFDFASIETIKNRKAVTQNGCSAKML